MTSTSNQNRTSEILTKARNAVSRGACFEADRLANKALAMARTAEDFALMADIVELLCEARQQRVDRALELNSLRILETPITEDSPIEPGVWLIEPPMVGADGRRFAVAALQRDVPVIVVCREPRTQVGLWPVVTICPGQTVRTHVRPPKNPAKPDLDWIADAIIDLGEVAIETVDPSMPVIRRIDALLLRIDALPEHPGLHAILADTCREAAADSA